MKFYTNSNILTKKRFFSKNYNIIKHVWGARNPFQRTWWYTTSNN